MLVGQDHRGAHGISSTGEKMDSVRAFLVRQGDWVAPRLMDTVRDLRDMTVEYLARDIVLEEQRTRLVSEPWFIDNLFMTEARVEANGWAFPSARRVLKSRPAFTLNGETFDECTIAVDRPDIGYVYWQRRCAAQS